MDDWAAAALAAIDARTPAALISILATEGSAPRGAGTRMLVTANAIAGTIGGGALEHQAIAQARALLDHTPGNWRVQDYPLGPLLGQCCGGRVRLLVEHIDARAAEWIGRSGTLATRFERDRLSRSIIEVGTPVTPVSARGDKPVPGDNMIERLDPALRPVMLFGAGHVGRAVAHAVQQLPIQLGWFDTRSELGDLPGVTAIEEASIADCVGDATQHTAVLIMTHDHGLDYALTIAALKSPASFVGLIGSATKRARFLGKLERDGIGETARARLTCPIGVTGITGKEPAVIAIAVAAQLLQLRASAA